MARNSRIGGWSLFALGILFWAIVACLIPPSFSGGDVAIFRDPGSNLALEHRFVAVGLIYSGDLQTRLFAHYTPIVPLAYGIFASVFGVGPRTATFFFLLVNIAIVGLAFYLLNRMRIHSRRGTVVRVLFVVLMPVLFSEPDRPESIGILLLMLAVLASLRESKAWWAVCGVAMAATFLAHPYAGILAAMWVATVCCLRARLGQTSWASAGTNLAACGAVAASLVGAAAGVFYWLDPTSPARFLQHSFGGKSGLGILKPEVHSSFLSNFVRHYLALLGHTLTPHNMLYFSFLGLLALAALVGWRFIRTGGGRGPAEHWVAGCSLIALLSVPVLFPNQGEYFAVAAFFVAFATLAISGATGSPQLARRALFYMAIVLLSRVPMWFFYLLPRVESTTTYAQSLHQPDDLLARLPSKDQTVAIDGGSYDLFKAKTPHLVGLLAFVPGEDLSQVQGIAFCPTAVPNLSASEFEHWDVLDRSQFELLERAPIRTRLTLFGHPVGQSYWGWGCDLYVRRGAAGSTK